MPASQYYSLLGVATTAAANLGITDWNSVVVPVVQRKLPLLNETLDSVPQIFVCPGATAEQSELWDTEGRYKITYYCDIVVVSPGNLDPTLHEDYVLNWRQRLRGAVLEADYSSLTTFYSSFVQQDPPFDRAAISNLYDYSAFRLFVDNIETR